MSRQREAIAQRSQFAKGSLFPVEDLCQFSSDRSKGIIVIESTSDDFPRAIEELRGTDARNMALAFAASEGVGDPRVNGHLVGPYAINAKGESIEKVMEDNAADPLDPSHASLQPAAYRVEVPVTRPMR